jgi:ATP synthase protein I
MTVQPRKDREPGKKSPPPQPSEGTGWSVMSYLIGGMALYGFIGWLIGRWTHFSGAFPIGMLVGLGLALALIIFRYAR